MSSQKKTLELTPQEALRAVGKQLNVEVMALLDHAGDQPVTQADIAKALDAPTSSLDEPLETLSALGVISREHTPAAQGYRLVADRIQMKRDGDPADRQAVLSDLLRNLSEGGMKALSTEPFFVVRTVLRVPAERAEAFTERIRQLMTEFGTPTSSDPGDAFSVNAVVFRVPR